MNAREKLRVSCRLFLTFSEIGLFTFGGGYAMIPMIEREICERKKWLVQEELLDIVAIAESTPGPIAVNAATFVGYRVAGVPGALAATLGVALPSFLIITLIAAVLRQFREYRAVRYAFLGIRAGVLALIFRALLSMFRKSKKAPMTYLIAAAAFGATEFLPVPVAAVIFGCALTGLVLSLIAGRRAKP